MHHRSIQYHTMSQWASPDTAEQARARSAVRRSFRVVARNLFALDPEQCAHAGDQFTWDIDQSAIRWHIRPWLQRLEARLLLDVQSESTAWLPPACPATPAPLRPRFPFQTQSRRASGRLMTRAAARWKRPPAIPTVVQRMLAPRATAAAADPQSPWFASVRAQALHGLVACVDLAQCRPDTIVAAMAPSDVGPIWRFVLDLRTWLDHYETAIRDEAAIRGPRLQAVT